MDNDQSFEPGEMKDPKEAAWERASALLHDLVGVPEPSDVIALARFLGESPVQPEIPSEPDEIPPVLRDQDGFVFEVVRMSDQFLFLYEAQPTYLSHARARELGVTLNDLLYTRK